MVRYPRFANLFEKGSCPSSVLCYISFGGIQDGNLFFLNCIGEHREVYLFDILYAIELKSSNDERDC